MEALKIKVDVDGDIVMHDVYVDNETGLDVDIDTGKMCAREETEETVRTIYRVGRESLKGDIRQNTEWQRRALAEPSASDVNVRRLNLHGDKPGARRPPPSPYDASNLTHKSADELKALGNEAMAVGKLSEAVAVYTAGIDKGPSAVLYANRAEAYLRLHKHSEALTDACKAVAIDARYGKAYYRKAVALIKLGHPTEALKALRAGLALTAPGPGRTDFEQRIIEVELSMRSVKTRREPGVGVVAYAAVPFEAGQTVLCEPPILTWPQPVDAIAEDVKGMAAAAGVDLQLARMVDAFLAATPAVRATLDTLYCPELPMDHATVSLVAFATDLAANLPRAKGITVVTLVRAIMTCRVNSHQCAAFAPDGSELCGLFPNACRLMHSCTPNLIYHRHQGAMKFVAVRSIAEDEVLSFSYIASRTLVESNLRRRSQLEKANMFSCQCVRCRGTDWTRGLPCGAPACSGTALWTGSYENSADAIVPMIRFERPEEEGWRCDVCRRRRYEYELPMEAEAGLEAALDAINTEDVAKVDNKYHNLKHVMLAVKEHLGDRHWTYAQLSVLLCKYHRVMAAALLKASPASPLCLTSQTLAMHWGMRYLAFLGNCGGLFAAASENANVGHMWRTALGRSCTKFPSLHGHARWLYDACLPYFTVVYGDVDESVVEMATFVVDCQVRGVDAVQWDVPFPSDVNELFTTWESNLQQLSESSTQEPALEK